MSEFKTFGTKFKIHFIVPVCKHDCSCKNVIIKATANTVMIKP